jgi:predicted Zn-dependent protease
MIRGFFVMLWVLVQPIRWLLLALLGLGLPLFLYLTFFASDPVFEPEQDVELGRRTVESIEADDDHPILPKEQYPETYAYVQQIVDRILESPEIQYRDLFAYDEVKLIDADVLNAFCTPGGFIYVYTGLIRYLDSEDHLAGVLGHEIAHAEQRHSSTRLQRQFGADRLAEFIVLSGPISVENVLGVKIAKELLTLRYSREQEAVADALSVAYLATSDYACDGAAGFFEKVLREGDDVRVPVFMSDHPGSDSRVRDIRKAAAERGCRTTAGDPTRWHELQSSLAQIDVAEGASGP